MPSYRCGSCGEALETDARPGVSEDCPVCHAHNTVPEPRLVRAKKAFQGWREERKREKDRSEQERRRGQEERRWAEEEARAAEATRAAQHALNSPAQSPPAPKPEAPSPPRTSLGPGGEVVYHSSGSVMVTNARLVVEGKTYAMANITSVLMGTIPANRGPGIVLALVGFVGFVGCVSSPEVRQNGLFVVGLLMTLAGVIWALAWISHQIGLKERPAVAGHGLRFVFRFTAGHPAGD